MSGDDHMGELHAHSEDRSQSINGHDDHHDMVGICPASCVAKPKPLQHACARGWVVKPTGPQAACIMLLEQYMQGTGPDPVQELDELPEALSNLSHAASSMAIGESCVAALHKPAHGPSPTHAQGG